MYKGLERLGAEYPEEAPTFGIPPKLFLL